MEMPIVNSQEEIIPRTIHYCWFGRSELPPLARRCMESWKKHMPEWKYMLWNEDNLPAELGFARKLLDKKLYAFVSDYVRLYALWKEGGIYLDTDIEVVRPLEPLLKNRQFIGCELEGRYTNAVCGAIAGAEFFAACLKAMDAHYTSTMTPMLSPECCTAVANTHVFPDLIIYPPYVFYPYNPYDKSKPVTQLMFMDIQPDTLTIHHWAKSWRLPLFRRVLRQLRKTTKQYLPLP